MNFIDSLLGHSGCAVDGSVLHNPLLGLLDGTLDTSSLGAVGEAFMPSFEQLHIQEMEETLALQQHHHQDPAYAGSEYCPDEMWALSSQAVMPHLMSQWAAHAALTNQVFHAAGPSTRHIETSDDFLSVDMRELEAVDQQWIECEDTEEVTVDETQGSEAFVDQQYSFLHPTNHLYQDDAQSLLEAGMRSYEAGELTEAMKYFESIIRQHDCCSHMAEAWRMLGVCNAERDQDEKAIHCLNRSLEYDPYNLKTLLDLGVSYVNELNSKEALASLRAWVEHNPKFAGLQIEPDVYSDGSVMDEVTQLMLHAQSHDPSDPDVLVVLGVLHNVAEDYTSAENCFAQALQSVTDEATRHNLLNKESNQSLSAPTPHDQTFRSRPAHRPFPSLHLPKLLPPLIYLLHAQLGATIANNNRSSDAIPFYQRALASRPTFVRGWLNLGISQANLGDYFEASRSYVKALSLNPQATHIWTFVKSALAFLGRSDLFELAVKQDLDSLTQNLDAR